MFRDFLKIFWARVENFCDFDEKWTHVYGFGGQKWDPCLGIFCQKPTHLGGTSPYSVSMDVPPRDLARPDEYSILFTAVMSTCFLPLN